MSRRVFILGICLALSYQHWYFVGPGTHAVVTSIMHICESAHPFVNQPSWACLSYRHVVQDVTAPLAQIMFSSLVLENLATGDVTSTLVTGKQSLGCALLGLSLQLPLQQAAQTVLQVQRVGIKLSGPWARKIACRVLTVRFDKCVLVCLLSYLAAPYSPIATINLYAVFCIRWAPVRRLPVPCSRHTRVTSLLGLLHAAVVVVAVS